VNKQIQVCCPIHGWFETQAFIHLKSGCKSCYLESTRSLKYTTDEYCTLLEKVHNQFYDYSEVNFTGVKNKIKIGCPHHGFFYQIADDHKCGNGCPDCSGSKGEKKIIHFLKEHKIDYIFQKSFNTLKYVKALRYDFYLPKYNILIEFDGIQHFEKVNFSGTFTNEQMILNLIEIEKKDKIKNNYATSNNIKLVRIKYTEIELISDILQTNIYK